MEYSVPKHTTKDTVWVATPCRPRSWLGTSVQRHPGTLLYDSGYSLIYVSVFGLYSYPFDGLIAIIAFHQLHEYYHFQRLMDLFRFNNPSIECRHSKSPTYLSNQTDPLSGSRKRTGATTRSPESVTYASPHRW